MERYSALRPSGESGVCLELRAETGTSESGAAAKEALCRAIPEHDVGFVSCFVSDAWWPGAAKHAVGMFILVAHPQGVKAMIFRSKLAAALSAADGRLQLVMTAQKWEAEDLHDLIDYFADSNIPLVERRRLVAGFLIHPAFCQRWHQRLAAEQQAASPEQQAATLAPASADVPPRTLASPAGVAGAAAAATREAGPARFTIRRHAVTNAAQAIVLAATPATKAGADRGQIVVPIEHLLHKICRLGRNDREIPIGKSSLILLLLHPRRKFH